MSRIRPLELADADRLATLEAADREILAMYDYPDDWFTLAGQRARIAALAPRVEAGTTHPFAILDDGAIAGTINLFGIVRESLQSGVIGYWVDVSRNGRGLATGAVGEILAYAFGELDVHRVEAATLLDNVSSQRVLEKNGFERIGVARKFLRIDDDWRDFILFQRLVED